MSARRAPESPPDLAENAHKGDAGRVLLLAGSSDMPGAAVLAARAASRAGAGLVTVAGADARVQGAVAHAAPEAILADLTSGHARADWRATLAARSDHARLAGPGLGNSARTRAFVEVLLAAPGEERPAPLVLDADALGVFAGELDALRSARAPLVLTPHPGEAARLLGRPVGNDEEARRAAVLELAQRSGATCVLKGSGTLIADGEHIAREDGGNPGMATAGSGDVLAGVLVAYLARWVASGQPLDRHAVACAAVAVHARAGDLAAEALGRRALIASDLVDHLAAAQG